MQKRCYFQGNLFLPCPTRAQRSIGSVTFLLHTLLSHLYICSPTFRHFVIPALRPCRCRLHQTGAHQSREQYIPGEPIYSSYINSITSNTSLSIEAFMRPSSTWSDPWAALFSRSSPCTTKTMTLSYSSPTGPQQEKWNCWYTGIQV